MRPVCYGALFLNLGSFMKNAKLLILSCCAPCSCAAIKKLADENIDATVLFYNPNIYPFEEYQKRKEEQERVCKQFGIPFVELPYESEEWEKCVKGLELEPERGKRCSVCFYMRLCKALQYAKENHFDFVTSVLGVSKFKDLNQVNEAARKAWLKVDKPYFAINWRKDGLEIIRQNLIRELKLYSQKYCGCKYSLRDAKARIAKDNA